MLINVVLGSCLASFFNLIVTRTTRNESIILPRSHCDACWHPLTWYEMIPIASFVFLRGRCRYCHSSIGTLCFQTELFLGISFAVTNDLNLVSYSPLVVIIFSYLTIWDYHTQTIPIWPSIIWLGLTTLIIPWHFNYLKLLPVYAIIVSLNNFGKFIGTGDIDVLFLIIITKGVLFSVWVLFFACILALGYLIIRPQIQIHHKIAFLPFLFSGYVVTSKFATLLLTFTIP